MITPCAALASEISSGKMDNHFITLYGKGNTGLQKRRYQGLLDLLEKDNPGAQALIVNGPGRTELGGNHTDHNNGCVLAAAVDLDCVAAVTPVDSPVVILHSADYPSPIRIDLRHLEPQPEEQGSPEALVRGVAAAFFNHTGITPLRGFHGRLHATCLPGTGLSSSAAFSVTVGAAFNFLFYKGILPAETLALMAREAENIFFGKPCGLMDQMASAIGGTIFIDFHDPENPKVQKINCTLAETGYRLVIIDTGGSHVGLTSEYSAIPEEIQAAATVLGQPYGRGISLDMLLAGVNDIRDQAGDRATLRLLHFIEENDRTRTMAGLLRKGIFPSYLQCVEASGISSCQLLQNCATVTSSREQGILLALALSRRIDPQAVSRVHGGGFAGTVQSYVPEEDFDNYCIAMERIFGSGSVIPVQIGRPGVCGLNGKELLLPGAG
jgi:galactokinase